VKSAEIALLKEPENVPNNWVQFRITDVYVPEPGQILSELHGKDVLLGRVVDRSYSGVYGEVFAVVEVDGLSQPVVVAMKSLQQIHCD
jgi:hypothetical protein